MGFCKFIDKYELTKTIMLFYFIKHMYLNRSHIFFIATQKMPIQLTVSFKIDFTLVLCNKINEFLRQSVPFDMSHMAFYLLVCIFVQSLRRRS